MSQLFTSSRDHQSSHSSGGNSLPFVVCRRRLDECFHFRAVEFPSSKFPSLFRRVFCRIREDDPSSLIRFFAHALPTPRRLIRSRWVDWLSVDRSRLLPAKRASSTAPDDRRLPPRSGFFQHQCDSTHESLSEHRSSRLRFGFCFHFVPRYPSLCQTSLSVKSKQAPPMFCNSVPHLKFIYSNLCTT